MFGYVFKINIAGDEYNNFKSFYHSGILYADTYVEVVEKLSEYYKEENIVSIEYCQCVTDMHDPIILPYDIVDNIMADIYIGKDCKTGEEI